MNEKEQLELEALRELRRLVDAYMDAEANSDAVKNAYDELEDWWQKNNGKTYGQIP